MQISYKSSNLKVNLGSLLSFPAPSAPHAAPLLFEPHQTSGPPCLWALPRPQFSDGLGTDAQEPFAR